jgi:hypothetical protein
MNCITCAHPLPEGTKQHPADYFAQVNLNSTADDLYEWGEGTSNLLKYLDAVLSVIPEAKKIDEGVQLQLVWLARDLCEESQHRLERLQTAAELWEQRAKRSENGQAPQSESKEA